MKMTFLQTDGGDDAGTAEGESEYELFAVAEDCSGVSQRNVRCLRRKKGGQFMPPPPSGAYFPKTC